MLDFSPQVRRHLKSGLDLVVKDLPPLMQVGYALAFELMPLEDGLHYSKGYVEGDFRRSFEDGLRIHCHKKHNSKTLMIGFPQRVVAQYEQLSHQGVLDHYVLNEGMFKEDILSLLRMLGCLYRKYLGDLQDFFKSKYTYEQLLQKTSEFFHFYREVGDRTSFRVVTWLHQSKATITQEEVGQLMVDMEEVIRTMPNLEAAEVPQELATRSWNLVLLHHYCVKFLHETRLTLDYLESQLDTVLEHWVESSDWSKFDQFTSEISEAFHELEDKDPWVLSIDSEALDLSPDQRVQCIQDLKPHLEVNTSNLHQNEVGDICMNKGYNSTIIVGVNDVFDWFASQEGS